MHPAIIIGTVRSLWTWLWGRYHVPQNVILVESESHTSTRVHRDRVKALSFRNVLKREKQGLIH